MQTSPSGAAFLFSASLWQALIGFVTAKNAPTICSLSAANQFI
jgi:hypothetical protein